MGAGVLLVALRVGVRVNTPPGHTRLRHRRLLVTQHAGHKPDDRVGQHQGRQHAVGQDVVSDGDFLVDEVIGHSLVDPLVVTAEQDQML